MWRLSSDLSAEDEVAAHAPPDDEQRRACARAAAVYRQYAPRGQFRPWALLQPTEHTRAYRLAYPTLICASYDRAFLHDVRTGALVQTIDIAPRTLCYVDVNERHAFVCHPDAVYVFSRESGSQVLRVSADADIQCNQLVEDTILAIGNNFITPLSVSPNAENSHSRLIAGEFLRIPWFALRLRTHISRQHMFLGTAAISWSYLRDAVLFSYPILSVSVVQRSALKRRGWL